MKRTSKNKSILSGQVVALAFLFIFFVGSFGLATVGLRQQIADSAAKAVAMERRLVELSRIESRYTGDLAMALSPSQLEAQNQRYQLGLRQPQESQVIRVDRATQTWFAERRWNQIVGVSEQETFTFRSPDSN
jgi:hypothetical protein